MTNMSKLLAAAAMVVSSGFATTAAHAGAVLSDFQVFENSFGSACPGGFAACGNFNVVDNSSIYFITGFEVGSTTGVPFAGTTRAGWFAGVANNVNFGGGVIENAFQYAWGGPGGGGLPILPGTSDNGFQWAEIVAASPMIVFFSDANGNTGFCSGQTGRIGCSPVPAPEPVTIGLFGLGLAAAGLVRSRKRRS